MHTLKYGITTHNDAATSRPHRRFPGLELTLLTGAAVIVGLFCLQSREVPPVEVEMAGYATSLSERTASQQHNAIRSASAINGAVIPPGGEFSFNKTVKSWSQDRGYVKAPVSYDGELIKAFGGGVCQTSTTLYNAALLAGLNIVERHPHAFAPHYVQPGRDAAVAQYDVDLRLKNPYRWPVRIVADADEQRLHIRIIGASAATSAVSIECDRLETVTPRRLTRVIGKARNAEIRPYLRNPGSMGCRVVSYRIFCKNGAEVRRERLGDDSYESMNRVVQVAED